MNTKRILFLTLIMVLVLSVTAFAYQEAPVLKEQVEDGDLPPVDERLPEEPMVVDFEGDEIGVYGGELHYPSTYTFAMNCFIRESLCLFEKGTSQNPIPALARDYDVNEDATEFTFYLREGHKWSDGEPFTADDIMFWWNDIANNEELSPAGPPTYFKSGGPTELVKIDDHTVKFKFSDSHALFPKFLSFRATFNFQDIAQHYLKQFHPAYTDEEELQQKLKEEGFDEWHQLFADKQDVMGNPECPTLNAWKVVQTWPNQRMIFERNPYYYKVDKEGNQLPYIDKIVSEKIANAEMATMKVLDGQTDMQYKFMGFGNYTLLKEGEEDGGYKVLQWPAGSGWVGLQVNQNVQDEEKREIFHNRKFRYALSHAINRDEINELSMFGVGIKSQMLVSPMDPYYEEGIGETALEYDPEKANELLDEIGLDEKDSDGYRLLPNGDRLEITIETFEYEVGTNAIEFYDIVAEMWEEIGIKTTAKQIARELWTERITAGNMDIAGYGSPGYSWDISAGGQVPIWDLTYWAPLWGRWYASDGNQGEEPTDQVKELQDIYDQMKAEPDDEKRVELGRKILRVHDEELWKIGILQKPFQPVIVNERLRNVVEDGVESYELLHEAQTWYETLFFVDGARK